MAERGCPPEGLLPAARRGAVRRVRSSSARPTGSCSSRAALAELQGVKQRLITTLRLLKLSNQLAMIKANNFELKITLKA